MERLFPRIILALRCGKWFCSAPQGRLPYVAGEDVARTAAAVLRADPVPPGELAITGPQALTAEALVNSINIIFGASIDLVPVSEEALALHLQVSGFPKSTVREALIIEEVSKRGLAPFSDGVIEQMANCRRDSDVRCQMCSSSFCRRGVASSDAADSGRSNPFGRSVAGAGDGAATGGRFRWNRESMRVSSGGPAGRPFRLFEVGPFPLHPIPLPFRPFGL